MSSSKGLTEAKIDNLVFRVCRLHSLRGVGRLIIKEGD